MSTIPEQFIEEFEAGRFKLMSSLQLLVRAGQIIVHERQHFFPHFAVIQQFKVM